MGVAKWEKFSDEQLQAIFENSESYSEIARKIGYTYNGTILKLLKKIAKDKNFTLNLKTKTRDVLEKDKEEMINKHFGRLTVLELDKEKTKETGRTYFKCQCNCENQTVLSIRYDLLKDKNRPTRSCGCLQKEHAYALGTSHREDLTGKKFNKIMVLGYDEEKSIEMGHPYWKCKCECGTIFSVVAHALKGGQVSCGCVNSKGEYLTSKALASLGILYEKEYKFSDLISYNGRGLRFDFFIPEKNTVIECQGEQHYKPVSMFGGEEQLKLQQEYDELKRDYCKKNNIKLIEIPYTDYDIIDEGYILNLLNK